MTLQLRSADHRRPSTPRSRSPRGKRLEVTIYAEDEGALRLDRARAGAPWSRPSSRPCRPRRSSSIPGTQGDTLKAVQNLPGVARAPFGIGLLPVWGSSPVDTRVYVDGVNIPTLYHFGGLRSTVNSEMVAVADVRARRLPGVDHGLRPRRRHRRRDAAARAPTAARLRAVRSARRLGRCSRGR